MPDRRIQCCTRAQGTESVPKEYMTQFFLGTMRSKPQIHLPPSPMTPTRSTRWGHLNDGRKKSPGEKISPPHQLYTQLLTECVEFAMGGEPGRVGWHMLE